MTGKEMAEKLGLTVVQHNGEERDLETGYTSDLLSDVMANARDGSVLITIQAHKNTVAVASLAGCAAIVICNDRPIPEEMVHAAEAEGIPVYATEANQYEISARVHGLLG
ncbi:MAG: DRTGG domain-containing protein [Alkalispirochaetaceae bacterium]